MGLFDTSDIGIDLAPPLRCLRQRQGDRAEGAVRRGALERVTGRIVAIGEDARKMMGREPGGRRRHSSSAGWRHLQFLT